MWSTTALWKIFDMPPPIREYKFHAKRKWRLDYAWPDIRLAVEIEGGVWKEGGGRHNRASGFIADIDKYNMLVEEEWFLLRYLPKHINYDQIVRVYKQRKYLTTNLV